MPHLGKTFNNTLVSALKGGLAGFDSESGESHGAVADVEEASKDDCPLKKRPDVGLVPFGLFHIALIRGFEARVGTFFERGHGLFRFAFLWFASIYPIIIILHAIDAVLEEGAEKETTLLVTRVVITTEYQVYLHHGVRRTVRTIAVTNNESLPICRPDNATRCDDLQVSDPMVASTITQERVGLGGVDIRNR